MKFLGIQLEFIPSDAEAKLAFIGRMLGDVTVGLKNAAADERAVSSAKLGEAADAEAERDAEVARLTAKYGELITELESEATSAKEKAAALQGKAANAGEALHVLRGSGA